MEFVDHYAALNISRNATDKEIMAAYLIFLGDEVSAERFRIAAQAREILMNKRDRAQYDKNFGYLMVIQTEPAKYLSGICYVLHKPENAHLTLLAMIDDFKSWILKKKNLEWDEAQHENYSFYLHGSEYAPYLILRFAFESDLVDFARQQSKVISNNR